jgi:hypothetical protein
MLSDEIKLRILEAENAKTTWDPEKGGKRAWICFDDSLTGTLGKDPDRQLFEKISECALNGNYYPSEVISFHGKFQEEKRHLRPGDRIVQHTKLLCFRLWSVAEIFIAEKTDNSCRFGYITTDQHFGRGIWQVTLEWKDGDVEINVQSTACPGSWQFWLGLPVARYMQLRARRKAIESFTIAN